MRIKKLSKYKDLFYSSDTNQLVFLLNFNKKFIQNQKIILIILKSAPYQLHKKK